MMHLVSISRHLQYSLAECGHMAFMKCDVAAHGKTRVNIRHWSTSHACTPHMHTSNLAQNHVHTFTFAKQANNSLEVDLRRALQVKLCLNSSPGHTSCAPSSTHSYAVSRQVKTFLQNGEALQQRLQLTEVNKMKEETDLSRISSLQVYTCICLPH